MSLNFEFYACPLEGLFRVKRKPAADSRGSFGRLFCTDEFMEIGLSDPIKQINYSRTIKRGTIRGMHFQYPPFAEDKIVTCIGGEILDVAIDIRKDSPTFLHWHGEVLSAKNETSLFIPKGFAHGFQTLVENCQLLYAHSMRYTPDAEGVINALDSKLAIRWPFEPVDMSERDLNHPEVDKSFCGIEVS